MLTAARSALSLRSQAQSARAHNRVLRLVCLIPLSGVRTLWNPGALLEKEEPTGLKDGEEFLMRQVRCPSKPRCGHLHPGSALSLPSEPQERLLGPSLSS